MVTKEIGAPLRVMELFAGVGGFKLGLEGLGTSAHPKSDAFAVVWSSQFEPGAAKQHASNVYMARWGGAGHSNEDISSVVSDPEKFADVLAARPDVLVGGFPCQDYSVAKRANQSAGIEGKKGALWWSIVDCLRQLQDAGQPVKYLVLENVDRLPKSKSPTSARGRDFAIILSSLASLGYAVEWRVVNSADYGFSQRRKRVFMVGYHRSTDIYTKALASSVDANSAQWLTETGVLAKGLPAAPTGSQKIRELTIGVNLAETQDTYVAAAKGVSQFMSAGLMIAGRVRTAEVKAAKFDDFDRFVARKNPMTLGDVVSKTTDVPASFYIDEASDAYQKWVYLKGGKIKSRIADDGSVRCYGEGPVTFPDEQSRASRTIITGEGGTAPSRFKHVIRTADGRLRRLTPEELEELSGFPRGFTAAPGVSDAKRAFLIGNSLVVGVVREIGLALKQAHDEAPDTAAVQAVAEFAPSADDSCGVCGPYLPCDVCIACTGSTGEPETDAELLALEPQCLYGCIHCNNRSSPMALDLEPNSPEILIHTPAIVDCAPNTTQTRTGIEFPRSTPEIPPDHIRSPMPGKPTAGLEIVSGESK